MIRDVEFVARKLFFSYLQRFDLEAFVFESCYFDNCLWLHFSFVLNFFFSIEVHNGYPPVILIWRCNRHLTFLGSGLVSRNYRDVALHSVLNTFGSMIRDVELVTRELFLSYL